MTASAGVTVTTPTGTTPAVSTPIITTTGRIKLPEITIKKFNEADQMEHILGHI